MGMKIAKQGRATAEQSSAPKNIRTGLIALGVAVFLCVLLAPAHDPIAATARETDKRAPYILGSAAQRQLIRLLPSPSSCASF